MCLIACMRVRKRVWLCEFVSACKRVRLCSCMCVRVCACAYVCVCLNVLVCQCDLYFALGHSLNNKLPFTPTGAYISNTGNLLISN